MKSLSIYCIVLSLAFAISAIAAAPFTMTQVAYLKINKNRIFIYEYEGLPTDKQMADYLLVSNQPMHSDGRMTAAYVWPKGNRKPQNGFNTLRSIDQANEFLYNSDLIDKWEFAYMQGFNGEAKMVNCASSPKNELCR